MKYEDEIENGERFSFGENWKAFLSVLDQERIDLAKQALIQLIGCDNLDGLTFIDIGSGSGIHSLAAHQLGAQVTSLDYDLQSVHCTEYLCSKYSQRDDWVVMQGSVLDDDLPTKLGQFDVVYSWGVLHHTGNMAKAIDVSASMVAPGGKYIIALYNDQGLLSKFWLQVKRLYNKGFIARLLTKTLFYPYFFAITVAAGLVKYKNPLGEFTHYRSYRGMSVIHDWGDWLGGLPFEVAQPEAIIALMESKTMKLTNLTRTKRLGNNQFIFNNPK